MSWFLISFLALALWLVSPGCTATAPEVAEQRTDRAAELLNEIAKRGDQVYGVSVERCHRAELAAAKLPDLEDARALVATVRAQCDQAFQALEALRLALEGIDNTLADLERGTATIRQAAAAAILARDAFDAAQLAHDDLATFLGRLEQ